MRDFGMKIEGINELQAAMRELPDAVNRREMRKALVEAGQPTAELANVLAPTDSGILARSSDSTVRITPNQAKDARKPSKDEVRAFVGPSYSKGSDNFAPHAHLIEFGTRQRTQTTTGRKVGAVTATPFLRPAWDATRGRVVTLFAGTFRSLLRQAVERVRKKALRGQR